MCVCVCACAQPEEEVTITSKLCKNSRRVMNPCCPGVSLIKAPGEIEDYCNETLGKYTLGLHADSGHSGAGYGN